MAFVTPMKFMWNIQNISPYLIGLKPPAQAISSYPTGVDQIWKMGAVYHRFNGILT